MAVVETADAWGVCGVGDDVALRVWSSSAESIAVCLLPPNGSSRPELELPLRRDGDEWSVTSELLTPGRRYALRVTGPEPADGDRLLLDPYGRGVELSADGTWCSVVVDESYDWGGVAKPATDLDHTVVYELHARGFTRRASHLPEELRGTYAGLGHATTIEYLTSLGITAVELLPVQAFVTEERLQGQGLTNYWGYNTLSFFAPHAGYATTASQELGADAVLREFKHMVRSLHTAGIEVYLDVVYNHTAEEGPLGPTTSLRGLDDAAYYRHTGDGDYLDVTGCGNTVDASSPAAQRLILDSLAYWAHDVQIDGFRFDLAATLGRDENAHFDPEHPLLRSITEHPALAGVKKIAEPWDVGLGGWQTGNFPDGWSEWNDRYRDRMRDFWLSDVAAARTAGSAGSGVGRFATRFAGSEGTFDSDRGPLASVNFITAHDGFTMADLVSYNVKHNLLNGENNRDGTTNNNSFNHGYEGPTADETIRTVRHKAIRNLLGTLLLSSGVPMITAGDERGHTQDGNNNAYCQDNDVTWLDWDLDDWQVDLVQTTARLLQLRRENPALRPVEYGRFGETLGSATQMDWFDGAGHSMPEEDWNSPLNRTLQYLAARTPVSEDFNRILIVVHGTEDDAIVTLPAHEGATAFRLLWDSADDRPLTEEREHKPGAAVRVSGTSIQLFRAH